jgi:Ca2+-transporting ATPase
MRRAPLPPGVLFGRELTVALALAGAIIGAAATAAYLAGRALEPDAAQTMAFATVALAELLFVFSTRSPREPAWRGPRNRLLAASVVLSAAVVALAVYAAPLRDAFGTVALEPRELAIVLGSALLPVAVVEAAKAWRRR